MNKNASFEDCRKDQNKQNFFYLKIVLFTFSVLPSISLILYYLNMKCSIDTEFGTVRLAVERLMQDKKFNSSNIGRG